MNNDQGSQIGMFEAFMKMTPQQRDHVFSQTRGKIPGVEMAYKAAKNASFFRDLERESTKQ